MVNEQLYGRDFMVWHRRLLPAYEAIADTILLLEGADSIVDVGCGPGFLVETLRGRGFTAYGVEGSGEAEEFWPKAHRLSYSFADLTSPEVELPPTRLVCSFEVGEHLPSDSAARFADLLLQHRPRRLFFSAATPGQNGSGHVNERPFLYWIALFAERGYSLDVPNTARVRRAWRPMLCFQWAPWFPKNFLCFVPSKGDPVRGEFRPLFDTLRLGLRARNWR